jgi:hypothetical protein
LWLQCPIGVTSYREGIWFFYFKLLVL